MRAEETDGEHDIPFARIPKIVTVVMAEDAKAAQVMAVFDGLGSDIDDGDIEQINVVLDAAKKATLSTGEGVTATESMAEDLVRAQRDDSVISYRREAYPVVSSVEIHLAPAGIDGVVAEADRYRDENGLELVQVISGQFILIRDSANEDLAFTQARQRFVEQINVRFHLTGAVVAGRGPLKLWITPAQKASLRRYMDRNAVPGDVGKVVVLPRD